MYNFVCSVPSTQRQKITELYSLIGDFPRVSGTFTETCQLIPDDTPIADNFCIVVLIAVGIPAGTAAWRRWLRRATTFKRDNSNQQILNGVENSIRRVRREMQNAIRDRRAFTENLREAIRTTAETLAIDSLTGANPIIGVDPANGPDHTVEVTIQQGTDDALPAGIHTAPIPFDSLFGNASANTANRPPVDSWTSHTRNVARYANRATPAQQRAAEARREAEEAARAAEFERHKIDWNNTSYWKAPNKNGDPVYFPITQMTDEHLWGTINWIVAGYADLCDIYIPANFPLLPRLVRAQEWLKVQPAFRALLHEAIRRQLVFPPETYNYLVQFVFKKSEQHVIQKMEPWRDTRLQHQQSALQAFADEPVNVDQPVDAVDVYGKEFRNIKI